MVDTQLTIQATTLPTGSLTVEPPTSTASDLALTPDGPSEFNTPLSLLIQPPFALPLSRPFGYSCPYILYILENADTYIEATPSAPRAAPTPKTSRDTPLASAVASTSPKAKTPTCTGNGFMDSGRACSRRLRVAPGTPMREARSTMRNSSRREHHEE